LLPFGPEPVFSSALRNLKIRIHKARILPVVLYGSGTGSLILREEQTLRVFEKRVVKEIFGSIRDGVTGAGSGNYIICTLLQV
jgi:hypothetical protein